MSTFFYDVIDFIFTTKFAVFFLLPVPFYSIALFYRCFCFRGSKND